MYYHKLTEQYPFLEMSLLVLGCCFVTCTLILWTFLVCNHSNALPVQSQRLNLWLFDKPPPTEKMPRAEQHTIYVYIYKCIYIVIGDLTLFSGPTLFFGPIWFWGPTLFWGSTLFLGPTLSSDPRRSPLLLLLRSMLGLCLERFGWGFI